MKTNGGDTALLIASTQGNFDIVKSLLVASERLDANAGLALINSSNNGGITPLSSAATRGHAKIIAALLQYGAGEISLCVCVNLLNNTTQHLLDPTYSFLFPEQRFHPKISHGYMPE